MKTKKLLILTVLSLNAVGFCFLSGCTPIEDKLVPDSSLDYNKAMQPLTTIEYTNKVNRMIMPLLNTGESYLGHHLDIVSNKIPASSEITSVDRSIDMAQQSIESLNQIYEPKTYSDSKKDTLAKLESYKEALKRYKEALEKGQPDTIKLAADNLKNELSSLRLVFQVVGQ